MWLFTCRHDYENVLIDELKRMGSPGAQQLLPGLVRAEVDAPAAAVAQWDPVYALGVLPQAIALRGASIKDLGQGLCDLALRGWPASDGRFAVHALVPGQLKGQPNPAMRRRADLIGDAARKAIFAGLHSKPRKDAPTDRLAQLLLLDVDTAMAAAGPCVGVGGQMRWPPLVPAGLGNPPDDERAPSSAYRKLQEALQCLGEHPNPGDHAADLGACPGGWTHVLRQHGTAVTAVDRSPLAQHLMEDSLVRYVGGDAFAWLPAQPLDWLVSDVIAYPQRVPELLRQWCEPRLAKRFVVQMKFKGGPDFDLIDDTLKLCRQLGYFARAKHFFNDKHEVTLMGGLPS